MVAKNNPALFLFAIIIVILGGVFIFSSGDEVERVQKVKHNTETVVVKNSDDAASDTAAEDRRRLSEQMDQVIVSLNSLNDELSKQKRDNEMLKAKVAELTSSSDSVVGYEIVPESVSENKNILDPNVNNSFENELNNFGTGDSTTDVLNTGYTIDKSESEVDEIEWIGEDKSFIDSFSSAVKENIELPLQTQNGKQNEHSGIVQYATIDPEAVLFDAFVFDSLIGISPNQTSVIEPYRFKLELSQDNLLTNGFQLPEIESMRMSGYAIGEWSTSCVKGYITSATFIFQDGRIHTVGKSGNEGEKIAYITDEYGSPCIVGEKYSSLLEYASIHGGLKSVAAIGEGLSNAQFTTQGTGDNLQRVFTGDQGKLALGEGLSGGFDAMSQTIAARYANVRDVIVAKPEHVTVLLSKAIEIDYDANGRKVLNHEFETELESYYESVENNSK
ncbi:MAG: hypothetical protein JKY54_14150 [Flavobacteriales bacterium]|jgi:hypothetical protein|nr:hypothetical protein [Flavobacteriales bacterium]